MRQGSGPKSKRTDKEHTRHRSGPEANPLRRAFRRQRHVFRRAGGSFTFDLENLLRLDAHIFGLRRTALGQRPSDVKRREEARWPSG
eukprot:3772648-Pleurochrysis_carterae.AAC.9